MKTEIQLIDVQRALQKKHPYWSQDKIRWIAEQAFGIRK